MKNSRTVLGFAPCVGTNIPMNAAERMRENVKRMASTWGVILVDIAELIPEGVLYNTYDAEAAARMFRETEVDGVFCPMMGEDTGRIVPVIARALQKPVLLWGAAASEGEVMFDGFFATAKELNRLEIPFSYIPASDPESLTFEKNARNFLSACAVVARMHELRILQIGPRDMTRPQAAADETDLLRTFGVETVPISLNRLGQEMTAILLKQGADWAATRAMIERKMDCTLVSEEAMGKMAAMKLALMRLCEDLGCSAVAMQCRPAMQETMGIYPCAVAGLLTDEGLPVSCDSDLHGAVSLVLLQEAALHTTPVFYANAAARNPQKENSVLLWHCGNFPVSLCDDTRTPMLSDGPGHDDRPGCGQWRVHDGNLTVCRLDGGNGEYRLLMGHAVTCEGPVMRGTYCWMQVDSWAQWQHIMLTKGFGNDFACVHAGVAPILREACRYIPHLEAECAAPTAEQIDAWLLK